MLREVSVWLILVDTPEVELPVYRETMTQEELGKLALAAWQEAGVCGHVGPIVTLLASARIDGLKEAADLCRKTARETQDASSATALYLFGKVLDDKVEALK